MYAMVAHVLKQRVSQSHLEMKLLHLCGNIILKKTIKQCC